MKIILGSGVVGMVARFLLGDDWTVIPFGKSRFYSFSPPLDDNWITHDKQLDPLMTDLGLPTTPVWLQRAYSISGELIREDRSNTLAEAWLTKIFGNNCPPHATAYLASRMGFFVYDQARGNKIYQLLQQRYQRELLTEAAKGRVSALGDHYLVRNGVRQDFERCVSTIPINALTTLMGRGSDQRYKTAHCIHMASPSLNFEGATQVMVIDPMFSFYKCTILARDRFLFHCHEEIRNAGAYFMPIVPEYDLLDGTQIPDVLPLGPMPDLKWLEQYDIFPVGAYAQHDWCADLGSNFLRLVKYAGRGAKPQDVRLVLPPR